ncbi:hypothetical protein MSAN_00313700 [Mycena sanguinolenta]|uniref:Protein-tyrosine-phosphatase n=1 Tax=Mycena sanguinolenta TaxID=230812 RepID=A0A8H7DHA5_9AGAR|nr:hypothetical protein MSAN_00313700 [Mycena sanguinolenta]
MPAKAHVISAEQFASMHLKHTLAHAPDGVLFPFLHGLEGDNEAQNMFFANSHNSTPHAHAGAHPSGSAARRAPSARVPRFRGLVWVVADEDLAPSSSSHLSHSAALAGAREMDEGEFDESESDDEEEDSEEEDEDLELEGMDIDVHIAGHGAGGEGTPTSTPPIATLEQEGKHMHPVQQKRVREEDVPMGVDIPSAAPTPTTPRVLRHERRLRERVLLELIRPASASAPAFVFLFLCFVSHNSRLTSLKCERRSRTHKEQNQYHSPLLTCTFRAKELLRRVPGSVNGGARPQLTHAPHLNGTLHLHGAPPPYAQNGNANGKEKSENEKEKEEREKEDGEWEFRPARVPDGISLRNFGIQVPIYATLSDIVLYSPLGLASPTLPVLARRFVAAVERKRRERAARGAFGASYASAGNSANASSDAADGKPLGYGAEHEGDGGDDDGKPIEYNVFVLDADARTLREAVPELMMRVFPGGEARRLPHAPAPLVPLSDGMQVDGAMQVDGEASAFGAAADAETSAFAAAHAAPADAPVAVPIHAHIDATRAPNTVDFGQRERDEMRELTRASEILSVFPPTSARSPPPGINGSTPAATPPPPPADEDLATTTTASHWRPMIGQVFLGNSGDVPLGNIDAPPAEVEAEDVFAYEGTNAPRDGAGYDVCVECHEMAPFPSLAHLRAAEEHLGMLEGMWDERERARLQVQGEAGEGKRVRPPPHASAVIHLPFPSAPPNTAQTMNALLPVIAFLERCLRPVPPPSPPGSATNTPGGSGSSARRWSTFPTAASPSPLFFPTPPPVPGGAPRTRSLTSPAPSPAPAPPPRSRPLKVLIYSSDGYTESSPLALSLLMAVRRLSLPEAYLELQVAKRRSFFVYPGELGLLRRVEARMGGDPGRGIGLGRRMSGTGSGMASSTSSLGLSSSLGSASGRMVSAVAEAEANVASAPPSVPPTPFSGARPSAKSVSFAPGAMAGPSGVVPSQAGGAVTRSGRPRARTSPWLPSFGDHQSWFNDPRFDGSFPSRVLPFLYLGNLNHASNAYMLHALGITHVVSVGECALVPPPGHCTSSGDAPCTSAACRANHSPNAHFIQGKGPGNQGSLWIEEREGRIKVLDIQGVCDDGIDTLEPQLEPICEWIEKARQEGGQVLVHCRVGVSRSATVTIAYVMKHLSLPLVDAYLIVRSRRLSVLIQPNMRLLYNLCGWEIKLAKERADGDERRLRKELARTLTWPYLSKEYSWTWYSITL